MDLQNSSKGKLIKLARQLYQNAVSLNYGFVLWKFPGRRKPELFIGKIKKQKLGEIIFPSFVIAPFQKNTDLVYVLEPFFYTHGKEWFILNSTAHADSDKKKAKEHYEKFLDLSTDENEKAQVHEWLMSLQE